MVALLATAQLHVAGAVPVQAAVVAPTPVELDGLASLVRTHTPSIAACLPIPAASHGSLRIVITAQITGMGVVRDVRVGPASELAPITMACIAAVVERVQMPPPHSRASRVVRFELWRAEGEGPQAPLSALERSAREVEPSRPVNRAPG